jgi:hypothetical protein
VGCFLTGLSDRTYGTPTPLPWGIDFGDGIPRHPPALRNCFSAGTPGGFENLIPPHLGIWRFVQALHDGVFDVSIIHRFH